MLENEKIYLSNPYYFNDPYDSAFSINTEQFKEDIVRKIEQRIKEEPIRKKLRKIGTDFNQLEKSKEISEDLSNETTVHGMDMVYDLVEDKQQLFYDTLIKNQIKFKICCFSEIPDSILMWSHYANGHKGFCIGYDTSEAKIKELYPVFYHENFFPIIKTGKDINDFKFNSLIKYKDWKYENEWRLISYESPLCLKPSEIYLGARFDDININLFKDIASEKNCKLYQMEMNYSEYSLKAREIDL